MPGPDSDVIMGNLGDAVGDQTQLDLNRTISSLEIYNGGTFAAIDAPVVEGKTFDVIYQPQSVELVVITAALVADLDDDADVYGHFLLIQRTNPSLIPAWESAYPDAPGLIAEPQAVPEPAAVSVLSVGCCLHVEMMPRSPVGSRLTG